MENSEVDSSGKPKRGNNDEAILAQEREIEKQIASATPLVGPKVNSVNLINEYAMDDSVYQVKVADLANKYQYMRRTRPDGNCFYRSFGYAYLDQLLSDRNELDRFRTYLSKSKDELVQLGFPQFTIEDFHDTFTDLIDKLHSGMTTDELLNTFNDQGISDYIVIYLRLITSGYLQKNGEFFSNFIEGARTVEEFCHQEVEPMYKESDHIHIIALTSALNVGVCTQYMDRGESSQVNAHTFPDGAIPSIHLLYRPGHYDILYKS